jgi:SAM-dependent methyltransferase
MRRRDLLRLALPATLASLGWSSGSWLRAQTPPVEPPRKKPDVIYVPTPQVVVDAMLELAEIKEGDVLYDLGCGDGRIVVTAAKRYGIKAVGVDIDPVRIRESRENVERNGLGKLVTIRQEDLFQTDLSPASVVTLYLLPNLNLRLRPRLARLKPGTRIVSHSFAMRGARPAKTEKVAISRRDSKTIFLWVVPWEKG